MGLTYSIPPPLEEGISINFGFSDQGFEEVQPEEDAKESNPIIEEVIQDVIEVEQEIITQETIETEVIEVPKEIKKEKVEEKKPEEKQEEIIVKPVEPVINKKALYTGKKKKQKTNQGNSNGLGNEGSLEGDMNSNIYTGGGIGVDGMAYQLGGRNAINKPKPEGNQIEGKVVVLITVNRLGDVIFANAGAKGSTTYDKKLLERAKKAALKTKFDTKNSAPVNQQGKIIYDFKLN